MTQSTRQPYQPGPLIALILGDLVVLLSFVVIGRGSHALSLTAIGDILFTALPFIVAWFGITPWFGIYRPDISLTKKKMSARLLLGWLVAGPVALLLRSLFLGRPLLAGIMPTFALVSMGYIGVVALAWRLGYIWWITRMEQAASLTGLES